MDPFMMRIFLRSNASVCTIAIMVPFFVFGCGQKSQERHYEEIVISAPASQMPMMDRDPHAGMGLDISMASSAVPSDSGLAWDVPSDWKEIPGGGMRIVTFKQADDPDEIDVSIVSLGGMAGGVEANLSRWAKQIELDIDPQQLEQWIAAAPGIKTKAGVGGTLFDFTKFQQDRSAKSMIAAMIEIDGATVFVKMTGTVEAVLANQTSFKQLTQSVRKK